MNASSRTLTRGGMYWMYWFVPSWHPRDFARVKPRGNLEGWGISWGQGGWITTSRQCMAILSSLIQVGRYWGTAQPKGQCFLRKEGLPTYAILSRKLVLTHLTHFIKGFHRAFFKSHPDLGGLSTKVSLLLKGFRQKLAWGKRVCVWVSPLTTTIVKTKQKIVATICKFALYESSGVFCCGRQKPANPCHSALILRDVSGNTPLLSLGQLTVLKSSCWRTI